MAFLNQFATYFDSQERQTELYNLWSAIGVNTEKSILEEQNHINTEFTDINNFSEDTLRSWLAFFLQKIPYRITATTQVTVSLKSTQQNPNPKQTQIPKYSQLASKNGIIYTLYDDVTLVMGDERTVTAVQGRRVVETGTYNSVIKVQATNPDLNYLEVKINGVDIPQVSFETSYDQLSFPGSWKPQNEDGHNWGGTPFLQNGYGVKGAAFTVIADGSAKFGEESIPIEFRQGDLVVYDGKSWQRSAYTNQLQPIQFASTYAIPRNGYFAYYYNDYLYIKIFMGSDVSDPNGCQYEVSYINSDGIQGQIKSTSKGEELTFLSSFEDVDENPVEINIINTDSSPAVNQPSVGKLGLYLKQRLYTGISISSVPEYTAWFKAQPEIGDALVLSDWERYIRNGNEIDRVSQGIVEIYAIGYDGAQLSKEMQTELLERIAPYKDIAVLRFSDFKEIQNYLMFEYTSSNNNDAFEQYLKTVASQFYNIDYIHSTKSSLFTSLDLAAVMKTIQEGSPYESTGLILKGYHYYDSRTNEMEVTPDIINFESYAGEKPGTGWYKLHYCTGTSPDDLTEHTVEFIEQEQITNPGAASIYPKNSLTPTPIAIGYHDGTHVNLNLTSYGPFYIAVGDTEHNAYIECWWGMENEGILDIGANNGLRKLYGIHVPGDDKDNNNG